MRNGIRLQKNTTIFYGKESEPNNDFRREKIACPGRLEPPTRCREGSRLSNQIDRTIRDKRIHLVTTFHFAPKLCPKDVKNIETYLKKSNSIESLKLLKTQVLQAVFCFCAAREFIDRVRRMLRRRGYQAASWSQRVL
jgi:hypothetical protein